MVANWATFGLQIRHANWATLGYFLQPVGGLASKKWQTFPELPETVIFNQSINK